MIINISERENQLKLPYLFRGETFASRTIIYPEENHLLPEQ